MSVPLPDRRAALGLTQAELAHELGVTQGAAAAWEMRGSIPAERESRLRGLEYLAEFAVDEPELDVSSLPAAMQRVIAARRATRERNSPTDVGGTG